MMTHRYLPTYRQKEVDLIAQCAREGQSLALVGIAGTGKSNLVRYVQDPANLARFIGDSSRTVRFPAVDFISWDGTPVGLWQLMLEALSEVADELAVPTGNKELQSSATVPVLFQELKALLSRLTQGTNNQIMFVLDDCDPFLQTAATPLIEQLYTLRNSGFRDRLSYLLFTKKLPQVLLRRNDPKHRYKFFDLFSSHIYALGMYSDKDARQMLTYLESRSGKMLDRRDFERILVLAGGHSRLIYVLFELWSHAQVPPENAIDFLKQHPDVIRECTRIVDGLHRQEQDALLAVAKNMQSLQHYDALNLLVTRGLILGLQPISWFSALMPATLGQ